MRLIDADAFSRKIREEYHGGYSEVQLAPYKVDAMIEAQPTVNQWNKLIFRDLTDEDYVDVQGKYSNKSVCKERP